MHGLIHGFVACSHYLRQAKVSDASDEEASESGLEELRPGGLVAQFGPEIAKGFGEDERGHASDEAEERVGEELAGVELGDDRDAEHGFRTPEGTGDDDAGYGGEDDRAEYAGAPLANDLLDDEEDGRDGSVEGSGKASSGSHGCEDAELLAGEAHLAADERGDSSADLEGWVFGAQRVAAPDGE